MSAVQLLGGLSKAKDTINPTSAHIMSAAATLGCGRKMVQIIVERIAQVSKLAAGRGKLRRQILHCTSCCMRCGPRQSEPRLCSVTLPSTRHRCQAHVLLSACCPQEPELGRRIGMLYVVDSVLQGSQKSRAVEDGATSYASVFRNTIGAALPR